MDGFNLSYSFGQFSPFKESKVNQLKFNFLIFKVLYGGYMSSIAKELVSNVTGVVAGSTSSIIAVNAAAAEGTTGAALVASGLTGIGGTMLAGAIITTGGGAAVALGATYGVKWAGAKLGWWK